MPSDAEVVRRILSEETTSSPEDAAKVKSILETGKPDKGPSGPGEVYSQYIGGPAHDYLDRFLQTSLPGMPSGMRDFIVGSIVPETLTQAGIAAGTLAAPGVANAFGTATREAPVIAPMLKRLLGPTLGGAFGGFLEKGNSGDAATGAAGGLAAGATGEVLSAASQWFAKGRLAKQFAKTDPQTLGRVVNDTIKEFPTLKTPEQFGSVVWGGVAQDQMSEMYGKELKSLANAVEKSAYVGSPRPASKVLESELALVMPSGEIRSPDIVQLLKDKVIRGKTDFESLAKAASDLRLKGRTASGDPKVTMDGKQAREAAGKISDSIYSALATISPGLAGRYKAMDLRYARGAEMLRFLKVPGLVDENNKLNMRLLQEQFNEERRAGLNHTFSPLEVRRLKDALFRGADTTAMDIMRKSSQIPDARIYGGYQGIKPHISTRLFDLLRHDKFAGKYALPAPYISPKAATLGAQRVGGGIEFTLDRPISLSDEGEDVRPSGE